MFRCRTSINISLNSSSGSRHTPMGMPSSPEALPSFICLVAMLTSASDEDVGINVRVGLIDRINWMVGCARII